MCPGAEKNYLHKYVDEKKGILKYQYNLIL